MHLDHLLSLASIAALCLASSPGAVNSVLDRRNQSTSKDEFIESLISQMTIPDLVLQVHLTFGDNIVGPNSDNALYDHEMRFAPDSSVGNIHDWYPLNKTYYNSVQRLNLEKSRLKIPFLHYGECLHGVGSFNQSLFPQTIGLGASWDPDLVQRVGRAIGSEARSIGIHACLSPVLDLAKEPRWGRVQENWGEDKILTSHLGVAYASGLSKNSSWAEDAVVPVMKHFTAHGSPQGGINGAPSVIHGNREVYEEFLVPFKAAVDMGGVRGVMMAYSELDDVPCHVNPMLYEALEDWGFDGFVTADDTGMKQLRTGHRVASSIADNIAQWFNAGGMIQFYDYPLEVYLNTTIDLVANGTVSIETLQKKARRILGVKYDLGLFDNPYIADDIDPYQLTADHAPLTLEAAQKSIVLLENRNSTLPLQTSSGKKIALIGPFGDILNYGDYSGQYGAYPAFNASTVRQGLINHSPKANSSTDVVTSMGANTFLANYQYPIPVYHLSPPNSSNTSATQPNGLLATYYSDTNLTYPVIQRIEVPTGTWGLYPPPGLSSNNFSATWEGYLDVPVDTPIEGWLGVAVGSNTTARLYINGNLQVDVPFTADGNILSNIPPRTYNLVNSTSAPPGSVPFTFQAGQKLHVRIEYQTWNLYQKIENVGSLNSQIYFFWNLVDRSDPVGKAVQTARSADTIILALGASWNSDGEGGDRTTLGLSPNQTQLADAIFSLAKDDPTKRVIMVLQGGRPFAIPEYYEQADAVLETFFPGQSGGQAIADVLFGEDMNGNAVSPGGRLPYSIPRDVGQLPVYYNYKPTAHSNVWLDVDPTPQYPFGYGMSYTSFSVSDFSASAFGGTGGNTTVTKRAAGTFSDGDTVAFTLSITNNGTRAGSYVAQVYLLGRVSQVVQPVKQLVAFQRVYLDDGASTTVSMELEVDRYLKILDWKYQWVLDRGDYTFAVLENGGVMADVGRNVTLTCA